MLMVYFFYLSCNLCKRTVSLIFTPLPSPAGSIFINILQVFLYFRGDICLCKKLHEVGFHGAIDTSDF